MAPLISILYVRRGFIYYANNCRHMSEFNPQQLRLQGLLLYVIHFLCLGSRNGGMVLLAGAAVGGHIASLCSLVVI